MTEHKCYKCNALLTTDEISLYRKLISRSASSYLCLECLSERLAVKREKLEGLIQYYYESGTCCLFVK